MRLSNEEMLERIVNRHKSLLATRSFFNDRAFCEVDTPLLISANSLEPNIDPVETTISLGYGQGCVTRYLHTSPELSLKRVLSYDIERVYQLSHVFRDGEVSETHLPEFTLLEWYRLGGDLSDLIKDCQDLFQALCIQLEKDKKISRNGHSIDLFENFEIRTVEELWEELGRIDLRKALEKTAKGDQMALVELVKAKGHFLRPGANFEDAFFHIMVSVIEPAIGKTRPCVVTKWPRQMAVLAQTCKNDPLFAERFEIYAGGLELANAFYELTDPFEQRARFEEDNLARKAMNKPQLPINNLFLEDLKHMKSAAGIALGFDRLLMLILEKSRIEQVGNINWSDS